MHTDSPLVLLIVMPTMIASYSCFKLMHLFRRVRKLEMQVHALTQLHRPVHHSLFRPWPFVGLKPVFAPLAPLPKLAKPS